MIRGGAEEGSAIDRIDSTANPRLKAWRRLLTSADERRKRGQYLVEGPRLVLGALDAAAPVEALLLAPEICRSEAVLQRLKALGRAGPPIVELAPRAFAVLSQRDGPTGIAAVLRRRTIDLGDLRLAGPGLAVAAWDLADPGNLGSLLRLLDAVGATALLQIGAAGTDPEHPTAAKASMGALFRVPVLRLSAEAALDWARSQGAVVVATSAKASAAHWAAEGLADLQDRPLLLLLGSERHGLPDDILAAADRRVRIPTVGGNSSLNVTVAAGILLYEYRRRRMER